MSDTAAPTATATATESPASVETPKQDSNNTNAASNPPAAKETPQASQTAQTKTPGVQQDANTAKQPETAEGPAQPDAISPEPQTADNAVQNSPESQYAAINAIFNFIKQKLNIPDNPNEIDMSDIDYQLQNPQFSFGKNNGALKHIVNDSMYQYQNQNEGNSFADVSKSIINDMMESNPNIMANIYNAVKGIEQTPAINKPNIILPENNVSDFTKQFNKDLLSVSDEETAPWLQPSKFPVYAQDPFANRVYRDANQLNCLMNNAKEGYPYINYAPVNIIMDQKKHWMKDQKFKGGFCVCTYTGKDKYGNNTFNFTMPTKKCRQNALTESPKDQPAIPSVGFNQQFPQNFGSSGGNMEQYVTNLVSNYLNAAFTKTPYQPGEWSGQHTEKLAETLRNDPNAGLRMAQNSYKNASSLLIPEQVQNQNMSYGQSLAINPEVKNQMFDNLANIYNQSQSNPNVKMPPFMQYMDFVSKAENTPVTADNIKSRFDVMLNVPSLRNEMITTHLNSVQTKQSLSNQQNAEQNKGSKGR